MFTENGLLTTNSHNAHYCQSLIDISTLSMVNQAPFGYIDIRIVQQCMYFSPLWVVNVLVIYHCCTPHSMLIRARRIQSNTTSLHQKPTKHSRTKIGEFMNISSVLNIHSRVFLGIFDFCLNFCVFTQPLMLVVILLTSYHRFHIGELPHQDVLCLSRHVCYIRSDCLTEIHKTHIWAWQRWYKAYKACT